MGMEVYMRHKLQHYRWSLLLQNTIFWNIQTTEMIGCGAYIWGIRSRVVYFINGMIHSSLFRFMSYSLFYFFNTLTYLFNFLGLRIAKSKEVAEADPEKIGKDSKILEMGFVSCVREEVILLETAKKTSEEEEAVAAEDPAPEATIPEEEAAIEDPTTPEIEEATTQEAEATEEVEVPEEAVTGTEDTSAHLPIVTAEAEAPSTAEATEEVAEAVKRVMLEIAGTIVLTVAIKRVTLASLIGEGMSHQLEKLKVSSLGRTRLLDRIRTAK